MRRKDGQTLSVQFLNDSQTFDRVINPYVENLRRLGVDAQHGPCRQCADDPRERSYDFDIITHQMPMDYVPGLLPAAVLRLRERERRVQPHGPAATRPSTR